MNKRRDFLQLVSGEIPGSLDDPRKRTIEPEGFFLDLFQHLFREVEALLSLIVAHTAEYT